MLDYVYHHDQIIAQFVASLIPECRVRGFGPNIKAMGIIDDGDLIAGMVYHHWDPDAGVIEMSGAAIPGKQWLSRETLRRMYVYPFRDCACQMVTMRVAADNERLLRQLAALNYSFIKIPRLLGRDRDAVCCLLTYEDWVGNKINRRFKHYEDAQLSEAA
jgi:RimJ/RimL family protein N-acetyltransferase